MTRMKIKFGVLLVLLLATVLPLHADWLVDAGRPQLKTFDGSGKAEKGQDAIDRRGKVTIRRIKPQCKSDWNNDPTALPYFFYQLRRRTLDSFPCYVDNRGIELIGDEIYDYPIIYFTSHYPFNFTDDEVENLKKYLAQGGTLWLDDCTGSGPFMDSVPSNVQRLVPGQDMHLMLPQEERFRDIFHMVYEFKGYPKLKECFMKPFQVALVNGRPAIQFCPNDYGCQWEVSSPPTSLNPLGDPAHSLPTVGSQAAREQVYQFSINWLFYALTH